MEKIISVLFGLEISTFFLKVFLRERGKKEKKEEKNHTTTIHTKTELTKSTNTRT